MRWTLALTVLVWPSYAQDARPRLAPTAVYTLADHHTYRWTSERDPLVKIAGLCRMAPTQSTYTLACAGSPASEPHTGRRHFYSIAIFRDLDENHYLAACSDTSRNTPCDELRAGQTFSAEVEDQTIRIVVKGEQLPMRVLEFRPRPPETLTRGTPSQVRPTPGTPSVVSWSRAPATPGTPSEVRPSQVSEADGVPSRNEPSEPSVAAASPSGARLYVDCPIASARIYVDGQLIGAPPADVPVTPGRHAILVRASGRTNWSRRVEVPPGRTTRVTAELLRR